MRYCSAAIDGACDAQPLYTTLVWCFQGGVGGGVKLQPNPLTFDSSVRRSTSLLYGVVLISLSGKFVFEGG